MTEQNTHPLDDDFLEDDFIESDSDHLDDDIDATETPDDIDEAIEEEIEAPSAGMTSDEMDIDAALAAVSQLSLLAQDIAEDDISEGEYTPVANESEADPLPVYVTEFEQPHDLTMSRGQLASVIPALTLIILGGWLTFMLTTSNTAPGSHLLLPIVLIGIGVIFLSQWLTSARWSRGNFFIGTATLLIGGIQLYLSQVNSNALSNSWAMWIVAIGIALFGAGFVSLPRLSRLSIMGFLTVVAGGIAYVITSGMIDPAVIGFINNLWFVGVAIVAFMIFAPLLRRRQ